MREVKQRLEEQGTMGDYSETVFYGQTVEGRHAQDLCCWALTVFVTLFTMCSFGFCFFSIHHTDLK